MDIITNRVRGKVMVSVHLFKGGGPSDLWFHVLSGGGERYSLVLSQGNPMSCNWSCPKNLSQALPEEGGGAEGWCPKSGQGYPLARTVGIPPAQDRRANTATPWTVSLLRSRRSTFLYYLYVHYVSSKKSVK